MPRPRALLADDHSMMLAGLCKLVEETCDVVGAVGDGRALVEAAQRLEPDLIILDIAMPLLNGIDAARQIKRLCPDAKLIFLTMQMSPTYAREALEAGASGYLLKHSAPVELPLAINAALQGQRYLTPSIATPVVDRMVNPEREPAVNNPIAALTPRQREILQLIGEGKGTKEMATLLNVSVKTIDFHKTHLMQRLNIHTTAELMRYAITQGLSCSKP